MVTYNNLYTAICSVSKILNYIFETDSDLAGLTIYGFNYSEDVLFQNKVYHLYTHYIYQLLEIENKVDFTYFCTEESYTPIGHVSAWLDKENTTNTGTEDDIHELCQENLTSESLMNSYIKNSHLWTNYEFCGLHYYCSLLQKDVVRLHMFKELHAKYSESNSIDELYNILAILTNVPYDAIDDLDCITIDGVCLTKKKLKELCKNDDIHSYIRGFISEINNEFYDSDQCCLENEYNLHVLKSNIIYEYLEYRESINLCESEHSDFIRMLDTCIDNLTNMTLQYLIDWKTFVYKSKQSRAFYIFATLGNTYESTVDFTIMTPCYAAVMAVIDNAIIYLNSIYHFIKNQTTIIFNVLPDSILV